MIDERSATDTFECRFEPTLAEASQIRTQLRQYLDAKSIDQQLAADLELAASELLSNAVEQKPAEPIDVELTVDPVVIHLTVTNRRAAGDVAELPTGSDDGETLADRGWGLAIVHAVADGMWIHGDQTSFSVSCLCKRNR